MTTDFQRSLLRCLFQLPDLIPKIPIIDVKVFDLVEDQILFELLAEYIKTHNSLPTKVEVAEFYKARVQQKNVPDDVSRKIIQAIHAVFVPVDGQMDYVREVLNGEVLRKRVKSELQALMTNLKDTPSDQVSQVVEQAYLNIGRSMKDGKPEEEGTFSSAGYLSDPYVKPHVVGRPTIFKGLNRMTSAGGFRTPEFVIIMSAPKNFKTGVMIEMVLGYMRDGLKVYYADTENGEFNIRERFDQHMLKCTVEEMKDSDTYEKLDEVRRWYTMMGGNVMIDSYIAYRATPNDVSIRLKQLKEEDNYVPDIIVWDSIDHFVPSLAEDRKKEERHKIRAVYFEAIAINKKFGCFCFAPSQVNRAAVDKKVFSMKDFSEDFGKAFNCHAAFALCRTPEEVEAGIGRLVPVVQRRGVRYRPSTVCVLGINESIGQVEEISLEDAEDRLGDDL